MTAQKKISKLQLLPRDEYVGGKEYDPIGFYFWPLVGKLYRRRVELCLSECRGGKRVLEIGFGSGATFLNLADCYEEIHGLDLISPVEKIEDFFRKRGINTHLKKGNVTEMPFDDEQFDTVLLVSILEHLHQEELPLAMMEIARVLKKSGQMIYGVPIERPLTTCAFRMMGCDIKQHHFSTNQDIRKIAGRYLQQSRIFQMMATPSFLGPVYEVGHFVHRLNVDNGEMK